MAGINFVRRWVMSQMTKKADDGIMITLPDSSKVDLNVNITMDRLLRNGIDPDAFTNPQQVENALNMLNTRMVERAIPANSAEGREITEKLFGKQKAPVFDLEGNRIPEGSGIMGGKSVKNLMDSGQVSKGARGMKKSKKVEDREMFKAANERLTSDVNSIIKNIKSMEPITAMKEANSVIGRKGKYKNLTPEQSKKILQDTEDHIFERNIPEEDFADGGRIGLAEGDHVRQQKRTVAPSDAEFVPTVPSSYYSKPMPSSSPIPSSSPKTPTVENSAGITSTTAIASPRFLGSIFEDEEETESKANGGRAGFGGGGTMGASDKGYQGGGRDKEGNVSGDAPGAAPGGPSGDGPEDKGNDHQNMVQSMVNAGFTAKEINSITNPSTLDKIKNSPYNNLFTRGILRAGAYTLNPTIAGIDFRKAMQIKDLYDYTTDQLNNPVSEEDLTLGGITGIDPSMLTDSPYENMAPQSMATGGRAGFMAGGMGRRAFLKLMGGTGATIGAAKSGIFSGFGKGTGKEVAKEVAQSAGSGTPPPYFFKLVEKIKNLGDDVTQTASTQERQKVTRYKDYELTEDVATGRQEIQRQKVKLDDDAADYYGNPLTEETYMSYSPGERIFQETAEGRTKIIKTNPEYEEGTALIRSDREYAGEVVDESFKISDDVIEEAMSEAPSIRIRKASGGIARMLGE